jgi:hypothetical protein
MDRFHWGGTYGRVYALGELALKYLSGKDRVRLYNYKSASVSNPTTNE